MNNYANQIYFNTLCDEYHVIHNEFVRIATQENELQSHFSGKYSLWYNRLCDVKERISSFLKDTKYDGQKIIYNKAEHTEVLINFFAVSSLDFFNIIDLSSEFDSFVPDDKLSQDFLLAYKSGNHSKIIKLYKELA